MKSLVNEDDKRMKIGKEDVNVEVEDNNKKAQPSAEEADSQKPVVNKERNLDLQLDLEKSDRDSGSRSVSGNKLNHHVQKLHHQHPIVEKTGKIDFIFFFKKKIPLLFLSGKISLSSFCC